MAMVKKQWPMVEKTTAFTPDHADTQSKAKPSSLPNNAGGEGIFQQDADLSDDLRESLNSATNWLAENSHNAELATEHVLLGLASAENDVGRWLRQKGVDPKSLREEIARLYGWEADIRSTEPIESPEDEDIEPIDLDDLSIDSSLAELFNQAGGFGAIDTDHRAEQFRLEVLRAIDASANRAREGLRVVEDYVRFVLDDVYLTEQLKRLRHDLTEALSQVSPYLRLVARETQHDVGTALTTSAEQRRSRSADIPAANLARLQESLRSLEEFGKLVDPGMAEKIKQLRYFSYTIHRAICITASSKERLATARLYVLIDGCRSKKNFERLVRLLIEARVDIIQLRDKRLDDRQLLARGRMLADLTSASPTIFIMNDRPDLAVLSRADGVHVGQEELSVKDARTIVGPESLVGVSTHSIGQAREAVLDGADYIGVGPTFASGTKHFDTFPGLDLLRAVAAEISLPAFAIGGIGEKNLDAVLVTGFSRIAVSGAVTSVEDAGRAAESLRSRLHSTY